MLTEFSSVMFETARGFGVFAVLLCFVVVIWTTLLACIQLNRCQVWLYRLCAFGGVVATGMTFLMKMAPVCSSPAIFDGGAPQRCKIDHGGYAMIVASFMWFIVFIISVVWLKPADQVHPYDFDDDGDLEEAEKRLGIGGGSARERGGPWFLRRSKDSEDDGENIDNNVRSPAATAPMNTPPPSSRGRRTSLAPPVSEIQASSSRSSNNNSSLKHQQQQPRSTSQRPGTSSTTDRMPNISFDSQDNNDITSQRQSRTRTKKKKARVTVDDVSHDDTMEVYLSPSNSRDSALSSGSASVQQQQQTVEGQRSSSSRHRKQRQRLSALVAAESGEV